MYYIYLMISATEHSFEEMCSATVNRAKGKCLSPNEFSFAVFTPSQSLHAVFVR
jgi:hypothetical protein